MTNPDELVGRIAKTRLVIPGCSLRKLDEVRNLWPGSELDIVYENGRLGVVVIFESTEDCLAFKLKYGDEYE